MAETEEEKKRKGRAPRKPRKRTRRVLMKAGELNGHLRLIQRVRENSKLSPPLRKQWRCRCEGPITQADGTISVCGTELTIPEMYLRRKSNPKVDCGCQAGSLRSRFNNEYRIWLMVRERTRNAEHVANEHYTKRGIDICEEWYDLETGFELFFAHVGVRPTKDHSLDRIDNMRGYEPGNMRWATSSQQRANQGDMVAGYTEQAIIAAGYTRLEFTTLVSKGKDEHALIKQGLKTQKGQQ